MRVAAPGTSPALIPSLMRDDSFQFSRSCERLAFQRGDRVPRANPRTRRARGVTRDHPSDHSPALYVLSFYGMRPHLELGQLPPQASSIAGPFARVCMHLSLRRPRPLHPPSDAARVGARAELNIIGETVLVDV